MIDYKRALEIVEAVIQSEDGCSILDHANVMCEARDDLPRKDRTLLRRALASLVDAPPL